MCYEYFDKFYKGVSESTFYEYVYIKTFRPLKGMSLNYINPPYTDVMSKPHIL